MKVILTQTVPSLGVAGEVKEVKKGYGFNYLLPQGLAELATPGALKSIKHLVARAEKDKAVATEGLKAAVQALDSKAITITAKAKDGKLFGSVTKSSIVKALTEAGNQVTESMVVLDQPIKAVGEYAIVIVQGETQAKVKLSVVSA